MSGAFKAVAALASLGTVGALVPLMPYARALRRFGELDRLNRELESQYRLIVETSNDGIWLTNSAERTTYVNARIVELLGYTGAEIIGEPISAFLHAAGAHGPGKPALPTLGQVPPAARKWCFRHKDGSERWADVSIKAIRDVDGTVAGAMKTIVTLAHSFGMRVIAEGIETQEQLEYMRSFEADCVQGYLIAKPLASAQLKAFIAASDPVAR